MLAQNVGTSELARRMGPIPNPVTAVYVSCFSVYIKSRIHLVARWKGFFFDAVGLRRLNATRDTTQS